jgi:hypothetical protein
MVTLAEDERERLQKDSESLAIAFNRLRSMVADNNLPETYEEFDALIVRQIDAITNLLERGETGHELATLKFDETSMTIPQHLKNLAFIAGEAKKFEDEDDRIDFITNRGKMLHDLKGLASTTQLVQRHIEKALGLTRTTEKGSESQWTL